MKFDFEFEQTGQGFGNGFSQSKKNFVANFGEVQAIGDGSSAILISKTITTNGSYFATDDGADGYSSISVNVKASADAKLPKLKMPTINFDNYEALLTIDDTVNGEHTEQYHIYYGDKYVGSTNDTTVNLLSMTDFTSNDELKVTASASQFNDSDEAVVLWEQPKLKSPFISMDNVTSTLVIVDVDADNTAAYNIYADGVLLVRTTETTVALEDYTSAPTTLRTISVIASAKNPYYLDSDSVTAQWFPLLIGTQGLAYTLSADGTHYDCSGIGTATDTNIIIGSVYNGLPVTGITEKAFRGKKNIESVYIPYGITSVGGAAFRGSSIKKLTLPNSITLFYDSSFAELSALEELHISDLVWWCTRNWRVDTGMLNVNPSILNNNTKLYLNGELIVDLVIPEGVTEIMSYSFANVQHIRCVTFPSSLEYIYSRAFDDCGLTSAVRIPESVRWIYDYAFAGSTLTGVIFERNNPDDELFLEWGVFLSCPNLKDVALRQHLTLRDGKVFGGSTEIKRVFFEGTEEEYRSMGIDGLFVNKDYYFTRYYNVNLDNFTFPETT